MVIDINLDDGLLDGMAAMQKFCKIAVTEPDVSKASLAGFLLRAQHMRSIGMLSALPSPLLRAFVLYEYICRV